MKLRGPGFAPHPGQPLLKINIKSFYTQQHCCVSLKTLYPGGIRTRVFLVPEADAMSTV
jgi:hypothetical protein